MLLYIHGVQVTPVPQFRGLNLGIFGQNTPHVARRFLVTKNDIVTSPEQHRRHNIQPGQLCFEPFHVFILHRPLPSFAVTAIGFRRRLGKNDGRIGGKSLEILGQ